jgi:hypothetical protein
MLPQLPRSITDPTEVNLFNLATHEKIDDWGCPLGCMHRMIELFLQQTNLQWIVEITQRHKVVGLSVRGVVVMKRGPTAGCKSNPDHR